MTANRSDEFEERSIELIQYENQRNQIEKEKKLQYVWSNSKISNICIVRVLEGKKERKWVKNYFEK